MSGHIRTWRADMYQPPPEDSPPPPPTELIQETPSNALIPYTFQLATPPSGYVSLPRTYPHEEFYPYTRSPPEMQWIPPPPMTASSSYTPPAPPQPFVGMRRGGSPFTVHHVCRICNRPRSVRYHRDHPIYPGGAKPSSGICHRCRGIEEVDEVIEERVVVRQEESKSSSSSSTRSPPDNKSHRGSKTSEPKAQPSRSQGQLTIIIKDGNVRSSSSSSSEETVTPTTKSDRSHRGDEKVVYRHVKGSKSARTKASKKAKKSPSPTISDDTAKSTAKSESVTKEKIIYRYVKGSKSGKSKKSERSKDKSSEATGSMDTEPATTQANRSSKRSISPRTAIAIRQSEIMDLQSPPPKTQRRSQNSFTDELPEKEIRKIARDEVHRYRTVERLVESHPRAYAYQARKGSDLASSGRTSPSLPPVEEQSTEPPRHSTLGNAQQPSKSRASTRTAKTTSRFGRRETSEQNEEESRFYKAQSEQKSRPSATELYNPPTTRGRSKEGRPWPFGKPTASSTHNDPQKNTPKEGGKSLHGRHVEEIRIIRERSTTPPQSRTRYKPPKSDVDPESSISNRPPRGRSPRRGRFPSLVRRVVYVNKRERTSPVNPPMAPKPPAPVGRSSTTARVRSSEGPISQREVIERQEIIERIPVDDHHSFQDRASRMEILSARSPSPIRGVNTSQQAERGQSTAETIAPDTERKSQRINSERSRVSSLYSMQDPQSKPRTSYVELEEEEIETAPSRGNIVHERGDRVRAIYGRSVPDEAPSRVPLRGQTGLPKSRVTQASGTRSERPLPVSTLEGTRVGAGIAPPPPLPRLSNAALSAPRSEAEFRGSKTVEPSGVSRLSFPHHTESRSAAVQPRSRVEQRESSDTVQPYSSVSQRLSGNNTIGRTEVSIPGSVSARDREDRRSQRESSFKGGDRLVHEKRTRHREAISPYRERIIDERLVTSRPISPSEERKLMQAARRPDAGRRPDQQPRGRRPERDGQGGPAPRLRSILRGASSSSRERERRSAPEGYSGHISFASQDDVKVISPPDTTSTQSQVSNVTEGLSKLRQRERAWIDGAVKSRGDQPTYYYEREREQVTRGRTGRHTKKDKHEEDVPIPRERRLTRALSESPSREGSLRTRSTQDSEDIYDPYGPYRPNGAATESMEVLTHSRVSERSGRETGTARWTQPRTGTEIYDYAEHRKDDALEELKRTPNAKRYVNVREVQDEKGRWIEVEETVVVPP